MDHSTLETSLNSETSGDSKNTFLLGGNVLGHHLKLRLLLLKLCPASVEAGAAPTLGMALLEDCTSPVLMSPKGLNIGKALIAQQGTRICSHQ